MNKKAIYILALISLPLLTACHQKEQTASEETYKTLTVSKGNHTLSTSFTATLQGRQAVEIRPQVNGTITSILINEGEEVHQGQILFIIDQIPYKAALKTAQANLKAAQARLQTAQLTANSKEQLYQEKVVSNYERQTAINQLHEAEAAVAQAKAAVTAATNDLSYTEIKSPVNGVAGMIPYRVGALVSSGIDEPLVTVSDDAEIYAYFSMDESQMLDLIQQYGSLQEALQDLPPVNLIMSNGKTYNLTGRIDAIGGTINNTTGAVNLRAVFKNPRHLLRHGGSASIILPTVHSNCIAIPQSATYELQNKIFTWKVVNGKTKSTPITVYKYNDGTHYIVLSGLQEGDTIVSEGAGLIREGTIIPSYKKTSKTK